MVIRSKLSRTGLFLSQLQNWEASQGSQSTTDTLLRFMLKSLAHYMIKSLEIMLLIKREQPSGWMSVKKPFICWGLLCTSIQILAFADFAKPFKLHTDTSAIGLCTVLYQEQDGKDRVITYASRALAKGESHNPTHKLVFLALKWAVTESFLEYRYGNTFALYSNNNPLTYVLTTTKLDATGHRWIAKLAKFMFTVYFHFGKSNVEVDALSRIPWDQNIREKVVKAILKVTVEDPKAMLEIYTCHEKAISYLTLESPPGQMTVDDWVQAQKADPSINQVITWIENKKLDTVKVGDEMSYGLKQYLRQRGKLCLWEGVLSWHVNPARQDHNELQLVVP